MKHSEKSNLIIRSITGALFGLLVIFSILGGRAYFTTLMLVAGLLSLHELYRIILPGNRVMYRVGMLSGLLIFGGITLIGLEGTFYLKTGLAILLPGIPLVLVTSLYQKDPRAFTHAALAYTGAVYSLLPLSLLSLIYNSSIIDIKEPEKILLGFFLLVWTNDTMAYLTGMTLGKHKLFERHSPRKTWEGTLGGILFTGIAAVLLWHFFGQLSLQQWLITGLLTAVVGLYGDLAESMIKRSAHIKDSGSLLPGHGGVLDRFDATLLAAPVVIAYLILSS
ncbi:MAG: phosphatidate cytidylyltransferase [Bacteroidales bacterium]